MIHASMKGMQKRLQWNFYQWNKKKEGWKKRREERRMGEEERRLKMQFRVTKLELSFDVPSIDYFLLKISRLYILILLFLSNYFHPHQFWKDALLLLFFILSRRSSDSSCTPFSSPVVVTSFSLFLSLSLANHPIKNTVNGLSFLLKITCWRLETW